MKRISEKKMRLTESIGVRVDPKLKDLAGEAADKAGVPLSEWVARAIAKELGKPELGEIPRHSIGRPRKQRKAVA